MAYSLREPIRRMELADSPRAMPSRRRPSTPEPDALLHRAGYAFRVNLRAQPDDRTQDLRRVVVSVVIPSFERPFFLKRAIASVLVQTFPHFAVIVVDDNNPASAARSETETLMEDYRADPRIRYLRHEQNQGGAAARNTGILASTGKYVAFLDDDDEWDPEKLDKQIDRFNRVPASVGLVYTGATVVDVGAGKRYLEMPTLRGKVFPDLLAHNAVGSTSTIVVRRELLRAVKMFDERLGASQDYDLYLRLAQVCKFEFVNEPLIVRHKHSGPRLTTAVQNKIDAAEIIYRKYTETFERHPRIRSRYRFKQARLYLGAGQRLRAFAHFLRAFIAEPRRPSLLVHAVLALIGDRTYASIAQTTRRLREFARDRLERRRQ